MIAVCRELAAYRDNRGRDRMGRLTVPQSREFRTSDADCPKGSGRKADEGGRCRRASRISISQHGFGQQQGQPLVRSKAAPMARRFGDVAPVQLERLIHIDTLGERPAPGEMRGLSQAECYAAASLRARPGSRSKGRKCLMSYRNHGLVTTEKEVDVVLGRNRAIVVAQEGG